MKSEDRITDGRRIGSGNRSGEKEADDPEMQRMVIKANEAQNLVLNDSMYANSRALVIIEENGKVVKIKFVLKLKSEMELLFWGGVEVLKGFHL
ncbi:hypothetical protein L2E82_11075 [Cichorium intybus]|uniref:Uncharacterized protein n=1 Tax=Cichorium intybus TaxID=13427 RepID=A0ACB9GDJ7_CICIN|nr:hypothetical protein L2E82_11075 [Cichorium intybus]